MHPDLIATITFSEDSASYLHHAFPGHPVYRIHDSIDPSLFHPVVHKPMWIAFMPRHHLLDAQQVLGMLSMGDALGGFRVIAIQNSTHEQTASLLREASIFLSFSSLEGFGLPPAEAMACGCITISYHGRGGKEFMLPEFSFPIEFGAIEDDARTTARVLAEFRHDAASLFDQAFRASQFIHDTDNDQREEADVPCCWARIMALG